MKKHLLSFLCFLGLMSSVSYAQISLGPNQKLVNGYSNDFDVAIYANFKNSSDEDSFRWVRTRNTLPSGWESAICDNIQCHDVIVDSSDFTLASGDSFDVSFHFYPYSKSGMGELDITIFSLENPDIRTSGTYSANVWMMGTQNLMYDFRYYPNPAANRVYFPARGNTLVYSAEGKLVRVFSPEAMRSGADVSDLSNGYYYFETNTPAGIQRDKLLIQR